MDSRQRARRDLAMVVESLAGRTYAQIAKRYDVCEKTVQRARRRVEQGPPLTQGATNVLDELWQRSYAAVEDLAFARLQAKNPRTRIAAIRAQAELLASQLEMLRVVGVVGPSTLLATTSVEQVTNILLARARRDGLGADAQRWLAQAVTDLLDEAADSGESGHFSA